MQKGMEKGEGKKGKRREVNRRRGKGEEVEERERKGGGG